MDAFVSLSQHAAYMVLNGMPSRAPSWTEPMKEATASSKVVNRLSKQRKDMGFGKGSLAMGK